MTRAGITWLESNRAALAAHTARVRHALQRHVEAAGARRDDGPWETAPRDAPPAAIDSLARTFGLTAFERDVLILCAAAALDDEVARLCGAAQSDDRAHPTFGLALAALDQPHWSALVPSAPLRYWRLVELAAGFGPAAAPLAIDERVLHHLCGIDYTDERVAPLIEPVDGGEELLASRAAMSRRLADRLYVEGGAPVHLTGADRDARRMVAAAACSHDGRDLFALAPDSLPADPFDRDALRRLCEREAALTGCAFLIEGDPPFAERLAAPVILSSEGPVTGRGPRLELTQPTKAEQRELWEAALRPQGVALNGQLDRVVAQFDFEAAAIGAAVEEFAGADGDGGEEKVEKRLWDACRARARPRLEYLAQRIEPIADWEDLVLPAFQCEVLKQITGHVRNRAKVYEEWGFAAKSSRGLGIAALFSGPSGTGKTMAAEVLARDLSLDLYRIDLSSVVSKYIGETEKNLRKLFGAAEGTGALLLFDEADALFGSRSEIRDSHDRYANIEVSYLLQRVESYRGIAVLTTNLRNAIDPAFLRRLRFVIEFPFPDIDARREIWRRVFPATAPVDGVDVDRLARLDVAGGSIRNIGLGAAFLAADAGEPIRTRHLDSAVREEYAKIERPLPDMEGAGWS